MTFILKHTLFCFRFFEGLNLTVPVDLFRYSPGGSIVTTMCVRKARPNRSIPEMLTEGARFMASTAAKEEFKECPTRYQRRVFKQTLSGPRQANLCLRAFRHDKF